MKSISVVSIAVLVGAGAVLALAALNAPPSLRYKQLRPGIYVAAQISPEDIGRIRRGGFASIIDLRPDGEAPDEPSSAALAKIAGDAGLEFAYVPTPHGVVPGETVDQFAKALDGAHRPTLLYCRSGKRAVHVWALSEASRRDGLDAAAITGAADNVGLPVADVRPEIEARIAARTALTDNTR